MEKVRAFAVDIEGTSQEITKRLNEVLSGIEEEGGRILDVKVTFAREHGIDGYIVLYTILYSTQKALPEE